MRRYFIMLAAVLVSIMLGAPVRAADVAPYDQNAFVAAEAAGKPILVAIHASWCPVCAKQRPILSQLEQQPEFKDLVVFMVDFDSQKNVVAAMGADKQSTLDRVSRQRRERPLGRGHRCCQDRGVVAKSMT